MSEGGPGSFFGFLARIGLSLDSQHSDLKLLLHHAWDWALLVKIARSNFWCSCERACEWLCIAARF